MNTFDGMFGENPPVEHRVSSVGKCVLFGIINNGMNLLTVHPAYQSIVKGLIIIGTVAIDYMRRC